MQKFLKKTLLFLFPLVVLSFVLDGVLSSKLKKTTTLFKGEYAVWNDIFEGKIDSDILIIGSSRAWVHFNPTMITEQTGISCYNIGIDGHPFLLQNTRYDILRKYNKKPKTVIVSLESNSFFKRPDLYNSSQFLPYLRTNKDDLKEPLLKFKGFNKYDFVLPLIRYYGNFSVLKEVLLSSSNSTNRVKGFEAHAKKWNSDLLNAKKKYKSLKVKIDTTTLNLFKEFVKKNKAEEIEVILVYSPEYIEGQEFISNRDSIINLYKKISDENKISFIDFSNDSISYKKEYFYNATHLNKKGANLFTQKLIDTLNNK
tara:strand:- start:12618 stop:13556 length:939 start_codon:yes stop_codon:yes gene_type:complete